MVNSRENWDTGTAKDKAYACSFTDDIKTRFEIAPEVLGAVRHLCETIKVEWQMLLTGYEVDDGKIVVIDGYWIPKQEVGYASVKNLECVDPKVIADTQTVAGIHSHGNMAVFMSGTDETETNMSLIRHNIVTNNKGDFKAVTRIDLPCGMVRFVEGTIVPFSANVGDVVGIENITKTEYKTPTYLHPNETGRDWRQHHAIDWTRSMM